LKKIHQSEVGHATSLDCENATFWHHGQPNIFQIY